jgi:hypothetical protein
MCEHTTDDTMIGTNTTRHCQFVCLMVFNATFNNISAISWRSVLGLPNNSYKPITNVLGY